jgi:hypothetical protein
MQFDELPRDNAGDIIPERVEWPVEIPLLKPVETGGRKLESITLREPGALDVEACWKNSGEMTRMVHLAATLAELSPDEVRALKSIDFMRAVQVIGAFL